MLGMKAVTWLRTQRQSIAQLGMLALIGFLAILALGGALGSAPRSARFSVAVSPVLLPRDGVYLVESFPDHTGVFQWVADQSWYQIPNPGGPLVLDLILLSGPAGATPIQIHTAQETLAFVVIPNLRTYHLLLHPSDALNRWLAIDAPTVRVGTRDLGIAVSSIRIAGGQFLPLALIIAGLTLTLALVAVVRSRPLLVRVGLLVGLAVACWWYLSSGWMYSTIGLALVAVVATCLTAIVLDSCWPTSAGQPQPVLALVVRLGILIAVLGLWLLLFVDRQVVAPIIPLGLAIATIGSFAFLRQAGWAAALTIVAVVLIQVVLLISQSLLGWQSPMVALIAGCGGGLCLVAVVLERWLPLAPPAIAPAMPWTRQDALITSVLIGLSLSVRLLWMPAPDPVGDIELAARRMGLLQANGLAGAYTFEGDYMPLWLYTVYGMSYTVPPLGGQFFEPLPAITRAMVKLPSIVADLATVALMYWWGRRWSNRRAAALIAALYTLSPPIWINSAWWGQADTLLMFPLVAALMLLDRAKGRWSWLLWAIALATKPQAIVLLPVLAVLSARRYGCRGVLQGGGITLAVLTAAALPLLVAGQGEALYNAAFTSVGRFPSVTNGAYNVGYLLTGRTQTDDTNLWLDLISYRLFGLCLLSAATLLICVALLRRRDMLARLLAASLTALAFVLLPTQIHERYLFLPLAFLVLCICIDRAYLLPYLLLMASATINIFGDLSGFWPAAATAIRASPLPYVLAIGNSGLLLVLLWRLALPAPENPRQMI